MNPSSAAQLTLPLIFELIVVVEPSFSLNGVFESPWDVRTQAIAPTVVDASFSWPKSNSILFWKAGKLRPLNHGEDFWFKGYYV